MSASGRPLIHLLREAHARDVLALLADGWKREKNPVYAWNAYNTARLTGLDIPKWVSAYLDAAAAAIMKAVQQAHSGETIGNEAEYVGKALGFGAGGPGQTPQFGELKKLGTDWDLHIEVSELIERGEKIDNAYSIVAALKKISRTTVLRAYQRISQRIDDIDKNEGS
jgi:hypothetical protein